MGGKAFLQLLPNTTFPRMSPAVYYTLKQTILPRLRELFQEVAVPPEAPEKADYGDLDFLTVQPSQTVSHQTVQAAIRAAACVPMDGNRTSNYAIAFSAYKDALQQADGQALADTENAYFQVDVHVCEDHEEKQAIDFMHSYGDLGMILGVLSRGIGLHLGTKGLRTEGQPLDIDHPPSFVLSSDFSSIVPFFGLSMERWQQGFQTRVDVYDWVLSSRFSHPLSTSKVPRRPSNQRRDRHMYHQFFDYADQRDRSSSPSTFNPFASEESRAQILADALAHFNRADEFASITAQRRLERLRRTVFTSAMVREWTGIASDQWRVMRRLMDLVRGELGGEDGMLLLESSAIKDAVLKLRGRAEQEVREEWERIRGQRSAQS